MPENIQKVLRELKQGLQRLYGDQLQAVILFGSYARGDARPPDSDIDVMIVLKGEFDHWAMKKISSEFVADLCLEYDVVISWFFVSDHEYLNSKTPFMLNVRDDAVVI
ncbi:MAG: nucleotidyltransferase domain-containing protein [Chloroflexota bacterium]